MAKKEISRSEGESGDCGDCDWSKGGHAGCRIPLATEHRGSFEDGKQFNGRDVARELANTDNTGGFEARIAIHLLIFFWHVQLALPNVGVIWCHRAVRIIKVLDQGGIWPYIHVHSISCQISLVASAILTHSTIKFWLICPSSIEFSKLSFGESVGEDSWIACLT